MPPYGPLKLIWGISDAAFPSAERDEPWCGAQPTVGDPACRALFRDIQQLLANADGDHDAMFPTVAQAQPGKQRFRKTVRVDRMCSVHGRKPRRAAAGGVIRGS